MFAVPACHSLTLDLGDVRDVAEVFVDGRRVAALWHAPYRVELPREVVQSPGAHALKVRVTNAWTNRLIGDAPEMIRYYMELRGIGVVNVRRIYGIGSVKPDSGIDLVVHLEPWQEGKAYDRLGLTSETENILGVEVPRVTIPVRPGRNLAVILELAAMNNRQKNLGYNAAEALAAEHDMAIDAGQF